MYQQQWQNFEAFLPGHFIKHKPLFSGKSCHLAMNNYMTSIIKHKFFQNAKKVWKWFYFSTWKITMTVYNKTFFDLHSRNARLNHLLHWWSYKKKVYLFFKVFTSLNTRFTLEDLFCGHINKHQKYLFLNKYKSEFYLFLQTRKHLEVYV